MELENFPDILKLSIKEKISLLENLWDSIRPELIDKSIPKSHEEELDQREKTLNIDTLLSLDDIKKRFKK